MESAFKYRLWYVWMVCLVAALGGLLFGYDWVVIGGAEPFYEKFFNLTSDWLQGWAMSCALIGCLFGALGSGVLSERFGRKKLLVAAAVIFAVSSIGTGMANHFYVFIGWRICGGVAIGLASSLSPMYIAEIAPANIRGRLVAVNQFTIVIGILLAQCTNLWIAHLVAWNGDMAWRWMFGVTAIPSLLFLAGIFLFPRARAGSPRAAVTAKPAPSWRRSAAAPTPRTPWRRSGPRCGKARPASISGTSGTAGCCRSCSWASPWRCFNNGAASTSSSIMPP